MAAVMFCCGAAVPVGIGLSGWYLLLSLAGALSLLAITVVRVARIRRATLIHEALVPEEWPYSNAQLERDARPWIESRIPTQRAVALIEAGIPITAAHTEDTEQLTISDLRVMGHLRQLNG